MVDLGTALLKDGKSLFGRDGLNAPGKQIVAGLSVASERLVDLGFHDREAHETRLTKMHNYIDAAAKQKSAEAQRRAREWTPTP